MERNAGAIEALLARAIQHLNAGEREPARVLCAQASATHPPHPAVLQLIAVIHLQDGEVHRAVEAASASLALRPGHAPTLRVAADAWFQLSLECHRVRDRAGEARALREVLRLAPERAEAQMNLGIALQEGGEIDAAMQAYGRAYQLREESFGRIAHALAVPPMGRLWLNLDDLRADLRSSLAPGYGREQG